MKEIKDLNLKPEEVFGNYECDWDEPLLEYVAIIAEEYHPANLEEKNNNQHISRAINDFVFRYLDDRINKNYKQKYLENTEVLQTIEALGYDVDKFWYLLLFILDYSTGLCYYGIKLNDAPKAQISKLINGVLENISPTANDIDENFFAPSTKIVLEAKGKRNITIDNPLAIYWLVSKCYHALEEIQDGSKMATSVTHLKFLDGYFENDPKSNYKHIWCFATMFQKFFELHPKEAIIKRGSTISLSKLLLISRLVYITGLNKNEMYFSSDDNLKKCLKKNKDYKMNLINGFYL